MKSSSIKTFGIRGWIPIVVSACLVTQVTARSEMVISTFNGFTLDGLFAWSDAVVVSTAADYSITDSGYGSGYEDINPNIDATGETTIQLTVTLSAPGAGPLDPISGPIVSLVDGDGTFVNFAWFGQTAGKHVLTAPLNAPTWTGESGAVPGLDLATLDFFHLQDDPGSYQGQYTIVFEDLRLLGVPGPRIAGYRLDPDIGDWTFTWVSRPGMRYTILHAPALGAAFIPLVEDVDSEGESTSFSVFLPEGSSGFVQILQQ